MKHKFTVNEEMLGVIRNQCFILFLIVLLYVKESFRATSTYGTIQNTLHITWCLLNASNIYDLLRYA